MDTRELWAFVDTEGAAVILGVTPQYVGRLALQGRLPWLPTGGEALAGVPVGADRGLCKGKDRAVGPTCVMPARGSAVVPDRHIYA